MSDRDNRKRAWRRLGRWALGLVLGWVVLASVEAQVVKYLDRQIRADRTIFTDYVARLPKRMDLIKDVDWRGACETHRVGYLWTYQICLMEWASTPECTSSPAFEVRYWAPPINLMPLWKGYYFGMPFDQRVVLLNRDKSTCSSANSNTG